MRGKLSTEHTNRNKKSKELLNQESFFGNNEYILEVENLVRNRKHDYQVSIDNERRTTFFGGMNGNVLAGEGFPMENYKSRRSLVRSSSTNFHAKFSYHPDYQVGSNLPSNREHFHVPKRGKTSQHSRPRKIRAPKVPNTNERITKKDINIRNEESIKSTISIEGVKGTAYDELERPHRRIGTAQAINRNTRFNFAKSVKQSQGELSAARKTITEKWLDLDKKKDKDTVDLKKMLSANEYQHTGFMYKRTIEKKVSREHIPSAGHPMINANLPSGSPVYPTNFMTKPTRKSTAKGKRISTKYLREKSDPEIVKFGSLKYQNITAQKVLFL